MSFQIGVVAEICLADVATERIGFVVGAIVVGGFGVCTGYVVD